MMNISFSKKFKKRFKKLPKKARDRFGETLDVFIDNPTSQTLRAHPLKGNLVGYRAFSISDDYRVIYKIINSNSIKLVDIGTHAQVYE